MELYAKDIMVTDFDTVNQNDTVETAIKMIFCGKIRSTGDKTTSLMVVDDANRFVGIITMFDILYYTRPGFLNYGVDGKDVSWGGLVQMCKNELVKKKIRNVMSLEIVGAFPDEHLMIILDRMVKNKYHRLPVLENDRLIGVVYIVDIYFHLFARKGLINQGRLTAVPCPGTPPGFYNHDGPR
ncbi:MAG: CBS domain-containing protein [Desulfobacter sp.]|nr:MAG: CBS domain-containing protein [Desulfobacter sp.]